MNQAGQGVGFTNPSSGLTGDTVAWYAVYTRGRHEKKVARTLTEKSIRVFLPLMKVRSRRRDRIQLIEVPMFSGYLFVHSAMDPDSRLRVLRTPGVVRILGLHGVPTPVPEEQVRSLQILVKSGVSVRPHRFLQTGSEVFIKEGPFAGVTGRVVRINEQRHKLVVSIDLLQRAVSVEIDQNWIEQVH